MKRIAGTLTGFVLAVSALVWVSPAFSQQPVVKVSRASRPFLRPPDKARFGCIPGVCARIATQSAGMQGRSNAAPTFATGCQGRGRVNSSLLLLVDASGSMGDEIGSGNSQVKTGGAYHHAADANQLTDVFMEFVDTFTLIDMLGMIVALQREHNVTVPDVFHFKYAEVALQAGSFATAVDSVNTYLGTAGREGEFYREALELLVTAEQKEERRKQEELRRKEIEARRQQIRPILPEMVMIPAGRFWMGCKVRTGNDDCFDDEQPAHEVIVGSFELSKTEITFEEYDRFTDATGRRLANDGGWGRGRRPVINVSWEDAVAYTQWLSAKTGKKYRLPSEAEWEYAARAGTETAYSGGDGIGVNRANCDGCGSQWDNEQTAPVGSFGPNGWGLHDMHGNVWEWVQDCWNDSYEGAPMDGSPWQSGNCSRRVLRGGSRYAYRRFIRSASRSWYDSGNRSYSLGFRVARTITP